METVSGKGDMFIKVETVKQGPIKGESQDDKHKEEIDVLRWGWGMQAKTAMSGTGPSGKSTVQELVVVKRVDSASTGLMSALRNNDEIKKAVLTMRKAGKTQHEYLKIAIEKARITALEVQAGDTGADLEPVEKLSFAFQKISLEYIPQGADGQPRGAMMFQTDVGPA